MTYQELEAGRMVQVLFKTAEGHQFRQVDTIDRVLTREIVLRRHGRYSRKTGTQLLGPSAPEAVPAQIELHHLTK